jgi:hypothetical protein
MKIRKCSLLGKLLLEPRSLTGPLTQEVQIGSADMRVPVHNDFFNARRVEQKGALDSDTIAGDAAHGEIGIVAALTGTQHGAAEFLGPLGVPLSDAQEYTDRITGCDLREIGICRSLNSSNYIVAHLTFLS